ncbi:DUF4435 domain-containing protein [Segatella baroniae]|uniref:DUF4435 domain-containing protein n=1 Tax=Segatella baroniae TaxID=305719 RepID=UPI0028E8803E|nr:DUF4435 domain-containing protein [Segatella baroniae]
MRHLKENINSQYFEAYNQMTSKRARRKIVAYVESYDDVYFWRTVLAAFENEQRYFEIMLPSRANHLGRGKKAALGSLLEGVGRDMIACVDADYDYLVQGRTETSQTLISNPYVFHTYAYAIENLQCYAPSLHSVCVAVTLNDHAIFDFVSFFAEFSEIIYPLFVWNIWHYRSPSYARFTMTDFNRVIELGHVDLSRCEDLFGRLRRKVGRKVQELQQANPDARASYQEVKESLRALGVTPQTTYLYIQGHHLFNKLVAPLLEKVCYRLYREQEEAIRQEALHTVQRQTELSCYNNSVEEVVPMLKKNVAFTQAEPFKRLLADLCIVFPNRNSMCQDANSC